MDDSMTDCMEVSNMHPWKTR